MIQNGIVDLLVPILKSPKSFFRKETSWIFSNLLAGKNAENIEFIFKLPGFLDIIKEILMHDQFDVNEIIIFVKIIIDFIDC